MPRHDARNHIALSAFLIAIAILFLWADSGAAAALAAPAGNWPGWRGDGNGVSGEQNLPHVWDPETGVLWRAALPGEGHSSPIVWGGRVFITASTDAGKKRHVICLGTQDGTVIWDRELEAPRIDKVHWKNSCASSTPVTDGRSVYAFFDSPGLVALDVDGTVRWTVDLGPFKNSYNMGSSPVLCDDLVIMCCDQDAGSFITAIDCATGTARWKTPRTTSRSYATPRVITVDGKKQIVVNGKPVIAYEPAAGKEIWTCQGMESCTIPSALYDGSLVYVTSGRNGAAMAIDPRGTGDVSQTHLVMHYGSGGPYVPSPVVYPHLWLGSDNGVIRLIDRNGKLLATKRLEGNFSASMVAGEGKVYWTNEAGTTYVLDAAKAQADPPEIKVNAANPLGGKVLASPAIADGRIYIRTDKSLYCIGSVSKGSAALALFEEISSFAELKKLYEDHPAAEGADVPLRLNVVERLAACTEPDAIAFLKTIAEKDNQLDIRGEAVHSLAARGEPALPVLIDMVESDTWGAFLKVIAAGHLGEKGCAAAVPPLLKLTARGEMQLRVETLKALAAIANAHDAESASVLPALAAALDDKEDAVKRAAIDGIALFPGKLGGQRDAIIQKLRTLEASKNPIVANGARMAVETQTSEKAK